MPSVAGLANPSGPEGRPVTDRTIRILGKTHEASVRVAYPAPDDMVDRTMNNKYDVDLSFPSLLFLEFSYTGFFWQGRFGNVNFRTSILRRKSEAPAWKDLNDLFTWARDDVREKNAGPVASPWSEPKITALNAVPCITVRAESTIKNNASFRERYIFPFEEDYALILEFNLTDNSDRPGLTKSNWQPRAEEFREKLLSTIEVKVVPKKS
jgi:hypothetical protein